MKRVVYVFVPVLILGVLVAFRVTQKRAVYQAQTAQRAMRMKASAPVSVATARIQDVPQTFDAVGSVEAPLDVKIAAKVTGRIDFLQVREGDRVARGQVVARINPAEVEADVHQQQAALAAGQYKLAEAQLNQNPTNVNISTQIRQQEAAVASANADLDQVRENYQAQVDSANAAVATLEANIRSARANLANAQAKCNRYADLYAKGLVSSQDMDDAKTTLGVAQAALDAVLSQRDASRRQAEIVKTKGQADIAAAQAKTNQTLAALEYARANTAQTPAYQQSLAALRAGVAAAQAALRSAEARRADTVLAAPFDGFVTGRYMDPGAIATAGQPILRVQYMRQVWVTIPVPEDVSASVQLRMPAQVSLDTLPGRQFAGRVTQVNPSADPQSRQFAVRVTLDNPDNLIKPGIYARVRIETSRVRGAIVVPREAVERDREGDYVMVVDESGNVTRRSVTVGMQGIDVTAITSGLRPGERVVTMSAFPLKDGQAVSITERSRGMGRSPAPGHPGPNPHRPSDGK